MFAYFFTQCCLVSAIFGMYNLPIHPNWYLLDHFNCGESLTDRIIGGTTAALGQYPWLARLGYRTFLTGNTSSEVTFKCAGFLINHMYVLTAAHCLQENLLQKLVLVRLGEYDITQEIDCYDGICAPPVQDLCPEEIIIHKGYSSITNKNDIGIIRLDRPAILHKFVSPVCLPFGPLLSKSYLGSMAEVAGWGYTSTKPPKTADILRTVRVPIVSQEQCMKYYRRHGIHVSRTQLCAGGVVGSDSCGGDSGGPLVKPEAVDGFPKVYAIGLVSFGSSACGNKNPGVYTNLARYVEWILDNIKP